MSPLEQRVRTTILAGINELLVEDDLQEREFTDDDVLLDTGLDSLGFVVLVSRLEDALECDPFTEMSDPVYPQTLGELVDVYARFLDGK